MTRFTDVWVIPWLAVLVDWSVRWGILLALLAAWFAVHPPRRAGTRHVICWAALVAGLMIPVAPRWGDLLVPWNIGTPAESKRPIEAVSLPQSHQIPVAQPAVRSHEFDPPATPSSQAAEPRATAISLSGLQLAALATASAWAFGVMVLLIRLAGGWLMLLRLSRGAVEIDGSDAMFLECKAALRLSRAVRLAAHRAIGSPVAFGWLRPCILVPPDWASWPQAQRRTCLLHELTHLDRRDDWSALAQELISVVFFFHPLVHWLIARLDRERELLCDEAIVRLGIEPAGYAQMLLELARQSGRILSGSARNPVLLPFLDRRTVSIRISRLLEDDFLNTLSRRSIRRSLILGSLTVAIALGMTGLRVGAAGPQVNQKSKIAATSQTKPPPASSRKIEGVIRDPDGKAVADSIVVAGIQTTGKPNHQVFHTDTNGRFVWPIPEEPVMVYFVAYKEGFTPFFWIRWMDAGMREDHVDRKLGKPEPFAAVVVNEKGKPLAGAKISVETIAHSSGTANTISTGFEAVCPEVIAGSPLEGLFEATTAADGSFAFRTFVSGSGLKLAVINGDGRKSRLRPAKPSTERLRQQLEDDGFITAAPGERPVLVLVPGARVSGRVVTKLPGVDIGGLEVIYQGSGPTGVYRPIKNPGGGALIDVDGRFILDGLSEGTINVFVHGDGENRDWTYRAASDVELKPGVTTEVEIELIRGVAVEGTVLVQGTNTPLQGAQVGVYGPFRPRSGAMTAGAITDANGRYRYRLPAGETYFYVMGTPEGFTRLYDGRSGRTLTIPDTALAFAVPPIAVAPAVTLRGHVLDAAGKPIAGATVVGMCENGLCRPFPGQETVTDARGEFRLPRGLYNTVAIGKSARLLIRLPGGAEHEATATPAADGAVNVKLPTRGDEIKGVEGPGSVAPEELAGVVVDTDGTTIEGAEVDVWTWYPGHEAKTDAHGLFRIGKLDKGSKVEVIVRKPGYTPQLFMAQPAGAPGWVIVLGNKTYFEGQVTDPDGKPVAGALIRANNGPKRGDGFMMTEIWTEAKTGDDGRYRMYAQSDTYDIQVRAPGVGVARLLRTPIQADEAKRLDIRLAPGVTFWAKVVDSLTGQRVPNVRLWHWQHPGVEGRPNKDGYVAVRDMFPGPFKFQVDAPGYARWWSDESSSEWGRRQVSEKGWQRNFDQIDFDLERGMRPVTITLEPAVTVTGRVLDPDGKPVAGATVAPARTGTFNSITGDTRFSFETSQDGTFTMLLPASGGVDYNLIAHDGKYGQWRQWANGVLPPMRTKPGEALTGVELRLTRPATVRGRVTDGAGHPVVGREVRASAADRLENRYYDPETTTGSDGRYELKFIRAGAQFIQVAPFALNPETGPQGTNRNLTLCEGESKDGVDFQLNKDRGRR